MFAMFAVDALNVARFAVTFSGAPDVQLAIEPNCHRSTSRASKPELLLSSRLFGPNGSSNVPFVRKLCVRSKLKRVFSTLRFVTSRKLLPLSAESSPSPLLSVYDVWLVKPFDNRFVT